MGLIPNPQEAPPPPAPFINRQASQTRFGNVSDLGGVRPEPELTPVHHRDARQLIPAYLLREAALLVSFPGALGALGADSGINEAEAAEGSEHRSQQRLPTIRLHIQLIRREKCGSATLFHPDRNGWR